MDTRVKSKMPVEDVFVNEGRVLLPEMLARSRDISSAVGPETGKALIEERKKRGQSPVAVAYNCAESWDLPFEAVYGFNSKVNRIFRGDGGIANQVVEFVYDEAAGKPVLTPKAVLAYHFHHLAHNSGAVLQVYITGHTDCGGIKAVQGDYSKETLALRSKLDALKAALGTKLAELREAPVEDGIRNALLAQVNVDFQVARVMEFGRNLFEKGRLVVAGLVRDVDGSYGDRFGDCYLINLNGITDVANIRSSSYLERASADVLAEKVRRLEQ